MLEIYLGQNICGLSPFFNARVGYMVGHKLKFSICVLSGLVGNNVQTQADVQCFKKELNFSFKEKSDQK